MRILIFFFIFLLACTREPEHLPDERKYSEDSSLLVNASQKFADETDVNKLHSIALAMQTTRTLSCIDYNEECTLFGRYLSLVIERTAKGTLTTAERKELQSKAGDIRVAVEEGKRKLRNDWEKRKKK